MRINDAGAQLLCECTSTASGYPGYCGAPGTSPSDGVSTATPFAMVVPLSHKLNPVLTQDHSGNANCVGSKVNGFKFSIWYQYRYLRIYNL